MKTSLANVRSRCVVDANDCWLWQGTINNNGYAAASLNGRTTVVHRHVHELIWGPLAPGTHVDHLCRARRCVNPSHLETVTPQENCLRAVQSVPALNAAKTHCPHGHEYTTANTYLTPRNQRQCRTCRAARRAVA